MSFRNLVHTAVTQLFCRSNAAEKRRKYHKTKLASALEQLEAKTPLTANVIAHSFYVEGNDVFLEYEVQGKISMLTIDVSTPERYYGATCTSPNVSGSAQSGADERQILTDAADLTEGIHRVQVPHPGNELNGGSFSLTARISAPEEPDENTGDNQLTISGRTELTRRCQLRIYGTAYDDEITLEYAADTDRYLLEMSNSIGWVRTRSYDASLVKSFDIRGNNGNDKIVLKEITLGATINGGIGNDVITGSLGNDTIDGGSGNDVIRGSHGEDVLNGGEGDDQLFGQAGYDMLEGGPGDDVLDGGNHSDRYVFKGSNALGFDKIFESPKTGRKNSADTLDFSGLTGIPSSAVSPNVNVSVQLNTTAKQIVVDYLVGGNEFLALELNNTTGIEWVIGSIYDDEIVGNERVNRVWGGEGDDLFLNRDSTDLFSEDGNGPADFDASSVYNWYWYHRSRA